MPLSKSIRKKPSPVRQKIRKTLSRIAVKNRKMKSNLNKKWGLKKDPNLIPEHKIMEWIDTLAESQYKGPKKDVIVRFEQRFKVRLTEKEKGRLAWLWTERNMFRKGNQYLKERTRAGEN